MSAEWVRPGERICSRELIDKHGDDLAGLLAEPLPIYGPGPFDILYWQPIRETKRRQTMIVPDKDPFARRDEIDAAPGSKPKNRVATVSVANCTPPDMFDQWPDQTMTWRATIKDRAARITAPFVRWYRKRDANAFAVQFAAALVALIAVIWITFAAVAAAYADDACRASGAWVRCQGIDLKADDIEGVEIVYDGAYGQKELTVRYAGGTEIVQVGAAHLDEALALLDRGAEHG